MDKIKKKNGKVNPKSDKTESFDYSQCKYECRLRKKGIFGYKTRFIYIMNNKLIICKVRPPITI